LWLREEEVVLHVSVVVVVLVVFAQELGLL
jgi:hypothetical protein